MRRTPDGAREVVEMLVPTEGSPSKTVRITGLGLPSKIGVGAVDLPDEVWVDLCNRDLSGNLRYDAVETVHGGMMPLHETPLQKGDQVYQSRSGCSFGDGKSAAPSRHPGEVEEVAHASPSEPTCAWIVSDARGKSLLVVPAALDSFDLVDRLAPALEGEFTVEMVTTATVTAAEAVAAPGWRVLVTPPRHPGSGHPLGLN